MTAKVKSVYEELNYTNADEMLIKARLVTEIADQVKRRRLTQTEASELLGFSQPKLSNLLRGQFRGISEKKLMECLTAEIRKPSESLNRMLAPHGNLSTENFFGIVSVLQKKTRMKRRVTAQAA